MEITVSSDQWENAQRWVGKLHYVQVFILNVVAFAVGGLFQIVGAILQDLNAPEIIYIPIMLLGALAASGAILASWWMWFGERKRAGL